MTMRVQLLVSEWCAPCRGAEQLWQDIARQKAIEFQVLDVAQREGREIVARLGLRTVPATVIDGELKFVGIPDRGQALAAVAGAEDRELDAVQHVGITLATTSAWSIAAAAAYLALIGAALVWGGGIDGEGPQRNAALHGFGLGFAALAVFAFGEHLLPRFTGGRIRGGRLAWIQQALLHGGVVLLAAGMTFHWRSVAILGGVLAWLSFVAFAARIGPVLRHEGSPT